MIQKIKKATVEFALCRDCSYLAFTDRDEGKYIVTRSLITNEFEVTDTISNFMRNVYDTRQVYVGVCTINNESHTRTALRFYSLLNNTIIKMKLLFQYLYSKEWFLTS